MFTLMISLALSAAAAEPATTSDTPTETKAKPVKAKKICRPGATTGSRLSSKICKTQAEWDAMQGSDTSEFRGKSDSGY